MHHRLHLVALTAATLAVASPAFAADGDLDDSFGTNGLVVTDNYDSEIATGMAIDASGRTVVVGLAQDDLQSSSSYSQWLISRYAADGSVDTSFGSSGSVLLFGDHFNDGAFAVAIDSNGKILVAGNVDNGSDSDIVVVRLTTNGSLDTSFASNGVFTADYSSKQKGKTVSSDEEARAIVLDSSGNIYVGGSLDIWGSNRDAGVIKLNSNGALVSGFGSNGTFRTSIGSSNTSMLNHALGVRSDGTVVTAVTYVDSGSTSPQHAVLSVKADGSGLENGRRGSQSFANKGVLSLDDRLASGSLHVNADGTFFVLMRHYDSSAQIGSMVVQKYDRSGSLSSGFGSGGTVTDTTPGEWNSVWSLDVDASGRIVATGNGLHSDGTAGLYTIRFTSSGAVDSSFGTSGLSEAADFGTQYGRNGFQVVCDANGNATALYRLTKSLGQNQPQGSDIGLARWN